MTRRQLQVGSMVVGVLVVALFSLTVLAAQAAGPASPPVAAVAPALDDPAALAQLLVGAFGNRSWPLVVVGLLALLLFVERHFRGLLGKKSSAWLGSPRGLAVTSLAASVVTAGLSAATGGWAALGKGLLVALVVGLLHLAMQWPRQPGPPPLPRDA